MFKLLAGRCPDADDLASQPTMSRFENAVSIQSLKRLRDVFIDQFIASFDTPPRHLTFDLNAVDDPAHSHHLHPARGVAAHGDRPIPPPTRARSKLEHPRACHRPRTRK